MVAEKLAKGLLATASDPPPPPPTHQAFVRLLQIAKNRPDVRRRLGYRDTASFLAFVDSLLPLAAKIEALAPSAAGMGRPNPEYPWRDPTTATSIAPADYPFNDFDARSPALADKTGHTRPNPLRSSGCGPPCRCYLGPCVRPVAGRRTVPSRARRAVRGGSCATESASPQPSPSAR
jgi:hypothetical protein